MSAGDLLFGLCAVVCLTGAIITISAQNPIRGAMGLLATIFGIAGLFLILRAEFLTAIQLIVYAGAVVVLFVFVLMLLGADARAPARSGRSGGARALGGGLFALTSVLEGEDMQVVSAETGRDAIRLLEDTRDVDIVLMDIMMPEMDGLDTTRAIRELPRFRDLPIIAVTAKAMKGDREKCIEAGAWDYLAKPVDPDQMLSVLRAWLNR